MTGKNKVKPLPYPEDREFLAFVEEYANAAGMDPLNVLRLSDLMVREESNLKSGVVAQHIEEVEARLTKDALKALADYDNIVRAKVCLALAHSEMTLLFESAGGRKLLKEIGGEEGKIRVGKIKDALKSISALLDNRLISPEARAALEREQHLLERMASNIKTVPLNSWLAWHIYRTVKDWHPLTRTQVLSNYVFSDNKRIPGPQPARIKAALVKRLYELLNPTHGTRSSVKELVATLYNEFFSPAPSKTLTSTDVDNLIRKPWFS